MPDVPASSTALPVSRESMITIAQRALATARRLGASDADVEVSAAIGQGVTVRRGEVETVEYNRDKGLGITVYFGARRGNASTSDLAPDGVDRTVEAACAIARHTSEDPAAGLPDPKRLLKSLPLHGFECYRKGGCCPRHILNKGNFPVQKPPSESQSPQKIRVEI